jgi:hypothetical protein
MGNLENVSVEDLRQISTSENFLNDRCRETERTVGLCDAHDSISSISFLSHYSWRRSMMLTQQNG